MFLICRSHPEYYLDLNQKLSEVSVDFTLMVSNDDALMCRKIKIAKNEITNGTLHPHDENWSLVVVKVNKAVIVDTVTTADVPPISKKLQ